MAHSFKPAPFKLASPGRATSWTHWLSLATCLAIAAVSGCGHTHQTASGGPGSGPTSEQYAGQAPAGQPGAAGGSAATSPSTSDPAARTTAGAATAGSGPQPTAPTASSTATATVDIVVERNDTLDHIFRKLKLNLGDLATLRAMPGIKSHLDNLRLGESLRIAYRDTRLDGFERRLNEEQTLKVTRASGELRAEVLQNPLESRLRTVRATIDSSLFEAATAAGAHDQTAVNLADIFQWDIDFVLDIHPGDSFIVTYKELYQDGVYVKDGPVLAAKFINRGRTYEAVRYVGPDGSARYFTPDGRSMHKAFLRAPLEFSRISSKFNSTRLHPILNLIRAHKGIDYAAPIGTAVRAAGDGRVSYAGPMGGYGNVVQIQHSSSIMTVYGHLSRFASGTHVGAHVTQGTVIAYVGMTGLATGPHLHYEYRVNGVFKNPQTVPLPDAAPIEAALQADFLAKSAPMLATLDTPVGAALVSR
jgi:murein DD-endopeptidase MepM/ murein hydrolase activator NlpD